MSAIEIAEFVWGQARMMADVKTGAALDSKRATTRLAKIIAAMVKEEAAAVELIAAGESIGKLREELRDTKKRAAELKLAFDAVSPKGKKKCPPSSQ